MRALVLLAAVLAVAGCAGGAAEPPTSEPEVPAWVSGEFDDGTVSFRYPGWWEQSSSKRFGTLLSDNRSAHPAFVAIRYFDGVPQSREDYAAFAGRTLRPPEGRGLTLLYTQSTRLGRLRGLEATFMWATRTTTPIGPTMRTLAVELPSGQTAFLVFAAERPKFHGGSFGWIRKTLRWNDQ
ncbi:MAG: hypothetical protein WD067_11065 [Gaiellaceae bacterium]